MAELAVRMVVSLAVVVGLLLLIARFSQKRFTGRSGSPLQVLHRQSLSRSSGVALVSVGGRMLLLGTTDQQVQMLTEIDPVEVDEAAADGYELPEEPSAVEPVAAPEPEVETPPARALVAVPDSLLGSLAGQVDEPTRWQPKGAKGTPAPQGRSLAAAATAGTAARAATIATVAAAARPAAPRPPRPARTGRVSVPAIPSFASTLESELSAAEPAPTAPAAPGLTPAQVLLQEEPDQSPLAGSLLSRDTWRLAARAVSRRAS